MLENIDHGKDQDEIIKNLEAVDMHIDKCITTGYEKIKSTPLQWWTEDIHHADLLVRYWGAHTSMYGNSINAPCTLEYIKSKIPAKLDIYQGDPNRTPPAQLRKAKKNRRNARKDSHKKRQDFLEKQIKKSLKTDNDQKVTNEIKNIKKGEKRIRLYQKMRHLLGKNQTTNLPFVDIPDITQFWAAITITLIMSLPKTMHILIAPIIGLSQISLKKKDIFGTCKPHRRITQKKELENALSKTDVHL